MTDLTVNQAQLQSCIQHLTIGVTACHLSICTQDGDEGVALESCEFWSAFCEASVEPSVLQPFLGRLIPVLLKNMVYDEYDEEVSEAEAAEENAMNGHAPVEERDQEVKPFINRCSAGRWLPEKLTALSQHAGPP